MSEKYVGQIYMAGFNFAPVGSLPCDGRVLQISQYQTLFAAIGAAYGGDGVMTFALPSLQGRTPAGMSTDNQYPLGYLYGVENVALTNRQNGPHTHGVSATSAAGSTDVSSGGLGFASTPATSPPLYGPVENMVALGATSPFGTGVSHDNIQPYLTINFYIVVGGIYPPRQ